MDFLFSMSIFSSAADISREAGKAQEWMSKAWSAAKDRKAAPAEQGKLPQARKSQESARFAVELDGINCFETIVSH